MLPFVAARDGYFFEWFHHTHATKRGLPDRSLLACGVVTSLCCFLNLDVLIESLMTTRAIVQFCAQAVGTIVHRRKRPDKRGPFRMPLFPIPALVSLFGFGYVLITTTSAMAGDATPLLESCLCVGWAMHFAGRAPDRERRARREVGRRAGRREEAGRRAQARSMELAGSAATAADGRGGDEGNAAVPDGGDAQGRRGVDGVASTRTRARGPPRGRGARRAARKTRWTGSPPQQGGARAHAHTVETSPEPRSTGCEPRNVDDGTPMLHPPWRKVFIVPAVITSQPPPLAPSPRARVRQRRLDRGEIQNDLDS